jgi:hypothetical protein
VRDVRVPFETGNPHESREHLIKNVAEDQLVRPAHELREIRSQTANFGNQGLRLEVAEMARDNLGPADQFGNNHGHMTPRARIATLPA